jgi:hypothetical protein
MLLDPERWLELRRFRALCESGATFAEIARETGLDWRTVKKYLEADGPPTPPAPPPRSDLGNPGIKPWAQVIDARLRAEVLLSADQDPGARCRVLQRSINRRPSPGSGAFAWVMAPSRPRGAVCR